MVNIPTTWAENGEWLQISFENNAAANPDGEIVYDSYLTDSFGKISFEFEDNGQADTINFNISFTDKYGNSPSPISEQLVIYPIENLVQTVQLTSNPIDYVILTDTTNIYETVFTTFIKDESNASIPNVNVDFYNNWNYGTLSSSNCVTSENGSCEITLYSTQSDTGSAQVVACVDTTEISRIVIESNGTYKFSWIENTQSTQSSRFKGKNNKLIHSNKFVIKRNDFVNSQNLQIQSEDVLVCTNGLSGSHTVQYVQEEQFYINQVDTIDVWVIAEEVIEDNFNVTVIDTIFARALTNEGHAVPNVPIEFIKI